MSRLCERPGCSAPAEVAYGMDPEQLLVWLEVVPEGRAPLRTGVVCRRHADAMVVPRGWTLDDRREARPRLFRVAADDATSEIRRIKRPVRKRHEGPHQEARQGEQQLSFGESDVDIADHDLVDTDLVDTDLVDTDLVEYDLVEDEPVVVADLRPSVPVDSDETQAMPWKPVFDDNDDLSGLLRADSPLLSRAFRGLNRDPKGAG
ncbi:MAG: hypothetical protein F2789_05530 [Actinobacteria bacterium]|nr:hypothetical protein [Actinomycetota bacterium]